MNMVMTNKILRILIILWGIFCAASAMAQAVEEVITITEGNVEPTPHRHPRFVGADGKVSAIGREIASIISDDLEGSGLFRPLSAAAFIAPTAVDGGGA